MDQERKIAYFSMEIGIEESMPTYSGGLGILAGDTILSAADLRVPMTAVTLLHRKGYFFQKISEDGWQKEEPVAWVVQDFAEELAPRVSVTIEGRPVAIRCWKYEAKGVSGYTVPIFFLDTDLDENADQDRELTHYLYGRDQRYRLCQEVVLGIGGLRMLRALGFDQLDRFHMNEGHAGLLTLELLEERRQQHGGRTISEEDIEQVRRQCVFTTHTPVAAGHDKFPLDLMRQIIGEQGVFSNQDIFCCEDKLNMTYLALNLSHYVNGVAKKHGQVSQSMFEGYKIDAITNGVHARRWTSEPFRRLFDEHIPGWREDNFSLRYALNLPHRQVHQAHMENKRRLIEEVNRMTNAGMDLDVLTIGYARRTTSYKRPDLIFRDLDRLKAIREKAGAFQLVFSGKAHPNDQEGKELIHRIYECRDRLRETIRIGYLENYDIEAGRLMTAGADLWLNTPQPPMEASGTSGMKAALNGVPSLSVLDGWWIEGCIEGITGWAIGQDHERTESPDNARDAEMLYQKLEQVVRFYYEQPEPFFQIMLHCIALNGSFFNTQRMMNQYVLKAYFE